ncbi:MAG: hypothetical protein QW228_05350 [Candidatus Aenigmatarchaeota archaeon]
MSADNEFKKFLTQEVINWGIDAGTNSYGIDKSTVNNLVSAFYGEEDPIRGVIMLQLYIARQRGRGEIPFKPGSLLMSHIQNIYNKYKQDREKLREMLETYLMVFKWSYESKVRSARNFEEFVSKAMS